MIAAALLASLLTATPEVILVKRSATGVPDATMTALLEEIRAGLEREGVHSRVGSSVCGSDLKCLGEAARTAKLQAALGVAVAPGPRNLAVDFELVDAKDKSVSASTFRVPLKGSPLPAEASDFFHITALLSAPETDAPRAVHLEPERTEAVEVSVARPRPLLRVAGVTTIATAAAGIGLLVAGLVIKGQLDAQLKRMPISISRDAANSQAGLSNALGVGSAIAFAVCGAAAVSTGILWLQPASEPPPEE
jgi:hypothetical protein